ncbi:RNA 2',3'-cyclic phosphodiesterase [Methanobacterium movens]|uniref:RNA 2',3'-cyclic phosphodiesterase n=1 Tax=Methanobacterium alkalithermotolerans TaxID=2731220 RepID=UPI0020117488|nr:RNA 2',3'-cyclic phosphodiesterase [Methanobacterium alkalithermotolerans]
MSDSSVIRTFLAADIDKSLNAGIVDVQEKLKSVEAPVKFVESENLHFTLKFFGDISKDKINEISSVTEEKLKNHDPFSISIEGMGVFPSLRYIRVLWIGTKDTDSFSSMQKDLDDEFIKMGFSKERSYLPHLTIGRLKGSANKELLVEKIEELKEVKIGNMKIDQLVLKKSELTPEGPIYTNLEVFKL